LCSNHIAFRTNLHFKYNWQYISSWLSYGSDKAITTLTGKSSLKNVEDLLKDKKQDSDLRKLVKKQIKETRKKLNLKK